MRSEEITGLSAHHTIAVGAGARQRIHFKAKLCPLEVGAEGGREWRTETSKTMHCKAMIGFRCCPDSAAGPSKVQKAAKLQISNRLLMHSTLNTLSWAPEMQKSHPHRCIEHSVKALNLVSGGPHAVR